MLYGPQLPTLFQKARLPRNRDDPVAFPRQAATHVQSFTFNINVTGSQDHRVVGNADSVTAQFQALDAIDSLRELQLSVVVLDSQDTTSLEPSSLSLLSQMSRLLGHTRGANIVVYFLDGYNPDAPDAQSETQAFGVLDIILRALAGHPVTQLSLRCLDDRRTSLPDRQSVILRESFAKLAARLRVLEIENPGWLLRGKEAIEMPQLERLKLAITDSRNEDELPPASDYGNLPKFIKACSSSLMELTLNFLPLSTEFDIEPMQLTIPKLRELKLHRSALGSVCPLIVGSPCSTLEVSPENSADWQKLEELLTDASNLPNLRGLVVVWVPGSAYSPQETQAYTRICALMASRSVAVDFNVEGLHVMPDELIQWLAVCANELVLVDCLFEVVGQEELPLTNLHTRIHLPKLRTVRFRIYDEEIDEEDYAGHWTMGAIFMRISAPLVRTLELDITTPYSEYLTVLCRAIRGCFPNLKQISGTYRIHRCVEGWNSSLAERRRAHFIRACRLTKIDISGLKWQAKLPKKEDPDSDYDF